MNTPTKKYFGLDIAVKVALQALHQNIAPTSVVFSNLYALQKNVHFPEKLEVDYFRTIKYQPNIDEKKQLVFLLDEFKKPLIQKDELLKTFFKNGWVEKKFKPKEKIFTNQHPIAKKSKVAKKSIEKPSIVPTVIVKKSKTTLS
jgi:hypothetical protein